jgi:hypothetical protein
MPQLFKFIPDIPTQSSLKAFGKKSVDQFRLTSSFDITAKLPAYAMMSGTILLQQQLPPNDNKVNLFIKPANLTDFKIPVKYIIYRGLDILDFLSSSNITDSATIVKTSGSELLDKMQLIQQSRAPGISIPVEALFGNELSPVDTKNIDEFFFKNLASTSQLFTIEGGIKLGEFAVGEIGIEILLENSEYFLTVEMGKKTYNEQLIIPADNSNPKLVKWKKDLIRHFVDPAAFYGIHHSISGGIGYRHGSTFTEAIATTKADVVTKVLDPFHTKNTVYLDVRNENGYSYNYYGNYDGTGTDATKEIKIGPTVGSLVQMEYYNDGWGIHSVSSVSLSNSLQENTIYLRLRIKDNERPLIAGNGHFLPQATGPNADQALKFIDESVLLPSPLGTLPEFTEPIQITLPNNLVGTTGEQIACLVRLDYHKQIRLNDGTDVFPYNAATDHLFGPITAQLPWDSTDAVQWSGTQNFKYFDSLNRGFVYGTVIEPIIALDSINKTIKINANIASQLSNKVLIKNSTHPENVGEYSVVNVVLSGSNETTITVLETFPSVLQSGDELTFNLEEQVIIDYSKKTLIVKGADVTGISIFSAGKTIWLYTKIGDVPLRYLISSSNYTGGNTLIVVTTAITKEGYGAVMETGFVVETDTVPGANIGDNVIHYAVPYSYYKNTGVKDTNDFNNIGGSNNKKSFLSFLKERVPDVKIEKFNLDIGVPLAILGYSENTVSKENLLLLGISQQEFDSLKSAASLLLSPYHQQMIKLLPQGNRLKDLSYQSYYKYNVVIAGLDASGTYITTTAPLVVVYSRDNMIFTSEGFAIGDEFNAIQFTQEEKFHLNNQVQGGQYNKKQDFTDSNSTFSYLYETKGAALKAIVDSFKTEIDALTASNFNTQIQGIILTKGKNLLDTARSSIRTVSDPMYNKDGALYLARLQMRKALKLQPLVANSFISLSKLEELLDLIEEVTRGLHATNIPDFSSNTEIPILISGFDPFKGIYASSFPINKEGMDTDYHLTNSSGNIALALHDRVLPHTESGKSGIIKGPVFPVRYREFDDGWIERFFEQYINPAHPNYQEVKMIITFSYGIESTVYNFEMERFAARKRGDDPSYDNNLRRAGISTYLNLSDKDNFEFIKSSLPTDKLFILDQVGLDQKAELHYYNGNVQLFNGGDPKGLKITNYNENDNDLLNSYESSVLFPNITNYPESGANRIISVEGSGGNYMSNEIFYRVAMLREKYNPTLKTGHIHVGYHRKFNYSSGSEITVNINKANMITTIENAIKQAIEIL